MEYLEVTAANGKIRSNRRGVNPGGANGPIDPLDGIRFGLAAADFRVKFMLNVPQVDRLEPVVDAAVPRESLTMSKRRSKHFRVSSKFCDRCVF
jgi:hypothetical protein